MRYLFPTALQIQTYAQDLSEKEIKVKDATSGAITTIPRSEIASHTDAVSIMPPMGAILQRREVRDLVAYLETLTQEK